MDLVAGKRATLLASVAVVVSASVSSDASADGFWPVEITSMGPRPILVEIAAGVVAPCDSHENVVLYRGPLDPNTAVRVGSPSPSVCFRQTYANFPTLNWSLSRFLTPPVICQGAGRGRRCRRDPDPTLRLTVRSEQP
jgi:hypothetical protein